MKQTEKEKKAKRLAYSKAYYARRKQKLREEYEAKKLILLEKYESKPAAQN